MRIGLVLVTYAHHPAKLIASVGGTPHDLSWYIHHHGPDEAFAERVQALARETGAVLHMHRINRGLARSWNEGLHQSFRAGAEISLLVNDDLAFVDDGFGRFAALMEGAGPVGLGFLHGLETGGSPYAGQVLQQGFACCAITPRAIERVGYFDETFRPAYYEDCDYFRRCVLADVPMLTMDGVAVEHERSRTTRTNPEIRSRNADIMRVNRAYYTAKWGGDPEHETFGRPFDREAYDLSIPWERRAKPYPHRAA